MIQSAKVDFLKTSASVDIFSLGILLLQIGTGCPSQLELPLKTRCRSINDKVYLVAPHFGNCLKSQIDEKHVALTIKRQERVIKNTEIFIKKSSDPYGLLKDKDFCDIIKRMISHLNYIRPNASVILKSKFVIEWTEGIHERQRKYGSKVNTKELINQL